MKKEKTVFLTVLFILSAIALLTGKPWVSLVIALMLFYLVLSILVVTAGGRKLTFKISAEEETAKGENAGVRIEAANKSLIPVFRCDMVVFCGNTLTGASYRQRISCGIFSKHRKIIEMDVNDVCCGMLRVELVEARIMDPAGLFSRRMKNLSCRTECMVLPVIKKTEFPVQELEHYDMESFRYADGKAGMDSSETVGIKNYAEGDSVRAIHWKLSAKTGDVVVKEYGYPVDTRIMLIADKRIASGNAGIQKMDALTEFCLSVSMSMAERDISHSFGWFDAAQARFIRKDVTDCDGIYALLPDFLTAPFSENEAGAALRFLESEEEKQYSSYLYITDAQEQEDTGLDQLREYGYVTILTPERIKENMA